MCGDGGLTIDGKIYSEQPIKKVEDCPTGEPINGNRTCEAYLGGRCDLTKKPCTREY